MNKPQEGPTLEEWVRDILAQRRGVLRARYAGHRHNYGELEHLYCQPEKRRQISDDLLHQLHTHLRGAAAESGVWHGVVFALRRPLPPEIANDLIDRNIAIHALGHSRQIDPVQWRLAAFYDEALLTLGIDLYSKPEYSAAEFGTLIQRFKEHEWLLRTLVERFPDSNEKENLFIAALRQHPEADKYMKLLSHRDNVWRALDKETGADELRTLYATQEPQVLRSLAANLNTPLDIIEELTQFRERKLARDIRNRALVNLRERKKAANPPKHK